MTSGTEAVTSGTEGECGLRLQARRPLVGAALAVLVGAWLGAALRPAPLVLVGAVSTAAGAWLALEFATREGRTGDDALPHALRAAARLALLCVLALASVALGWRGQMASPVPLGVVAEAGVAPPVSLEGRWEPLRGTRRGVLGKLYPPAEPPIWLELTRDCAAGGEWLRVTPSDRPRREARGPVPPPHAPFDERPHVLWSARPDEVERIAPAPVWERGTAWVGELRASVARRCGQFAAGEPRALAHALLYGATERLEPELADTFSHTGMRHVLAVSGMHVSLLAAVLIAPFVGGGRRRRVVLVLVAGMALALFAAVTGGAAPVRRAAVALALTLAAPLCARAHREPRRVDTLSLLALALLVEAALDLDALFSVSLLLSYLATLGLVLLTGPIRRTLPRAAVRVELGPTSARRALESVVSRSARSALAASLAAVLATLPLCWSTFGEWAPIGVVATALTTPLVTWLLVVGWIAILVPPLVPGALFDAPAKWFIGMLEFTDTLPGTPCVLPPRPLALLALATALLAVGWFRAGLAARSARLGLLLWGLLLVPWVARPRGWSVDALDVGHGTCVVLHGPQGPTWIFDAGSRDRGRVATSALGPLLASREVRDVAVVLSHTDSDHAEALAWLSRRYPILEWYGAAIPEDVELRRARGADPRGAGSVLEFAASGHERWQLARGSDSEDNEGSRTLLASLGPWRAQLHGDAVEQGLQAQLEAEALRGPVDVLLWPHHGDPGPWTTALLDRARPREVWISTSGTGGVERELDRRGIPWRSTSRDGPMRVEVRPRDRSPRRRRRQRSRGFGPWPSRVSRRGRMEWESVRGQERHQMLPLLVTLLLVPTVAPSKVPQPNVSVAQDEPELNRILHLRGGGTVRAKARAVDGRWEIQRGTQWQRLEQGAVTRAELERVVLAKARELERHVDRRDTATRVPYADWLAREGLLAESLQQLDLALDSQPDQPQALALLASYPQALAVPGADETDPLDAVRKAASAPRSLQELALLALGQRSNREQVHAALVRSLDSHSPRIRAFAALGLRRLAAGSEVKALVTRAVLDGSAQVRRECALALRDARDEAVTLPVLRALGSRAAAVRENAIEALGTMNYPAAVEPLIARLGALASAPGGGGAWKAPASHIFVGKQFAFIQDFDVEVAQGAAVADPQVNTLVEGALLDVRVIGMSEMTVAVESRKVRNALKDLTGANPGDTSRAWLTWWEQNPSRHRPGNGPRTPATRASNS